MKYTFSYLFLFLTFISNAQTGYFDGFDKKELKSADKTALKNLKTLQQQSDWQPTWTAFAKTFEVDKIQVVNKELTLVGSLKLDGKTGAISPEFWQVIDSAGKTRWSVPRGTHAILATADVIVMANDKEVLALSIDKGQKLWSHELKEEAIAVQDASIFLMGADYLHLLDAGTGKLSSTISLSMTGLDKKAAPKLLLNNNQLLLQKGKTIAKLDLANNQVAWHHQLNFAATDFTIAEETLVCYNKHQISSYALASGQENWTAPFNADTIATIIAHPDYILVWANTAVDSWQKDNIYALNSNTGAQQWKYSSEYSINSFIKEVGDKLFFTEKDRLISINKQTGKKLFDIDFPAHFNNYSQHFDRLYAQENTLYIYRPLAGVQAINISARASLWDRSLLGAYAYTYADNVSLLQLQNEQGIANNGSQLQLINNVQQADSESIASAAALDGRLFIIDQFFKKMYTDNYAAEGYYVQSQIYMDIARQEAEMANAEFNRHNAGFGLTGMNAAKPKVDPLKTAAVKRLSLLYDIAAQDYASPFNGDYFIHPIQRVAGNRDTGFKIIELSTGKTKNLWTAPGIVLNDYNIRNLFYLDMPAFEFQASSNQLIFADLGLNANSYEPLSFGKTKVPMSSIMGLDLKEFMRTATGKDTENTRLKVKPINPVALLKEGRYEQLKKHLESNQVDLNNTNLGQTLLYALIAQRSPNAKSTVINNPHTDYFIDYLIAQGVDLNKGIDKGNSKKINIPEETPFFFSDELLRYSTPLLLSVAIGDLPLAEKLVRNGANIEQKNYHGENLAVLIRQQKLEKSNQQLSQVEALYRL